MSRRSNRRWLAVAGLILAAAPHGAGALEPQQVTFKAADGVEVFADLYVNRPRAAPVVMLFHQARSSARGEYPEIIEGLLPLHVHVLAVDLRSGGDLFGGVNRTAGGLDADSAYGYCDAYPDMIAARDYLRDESFSGLSSPGGAATARQW